MTDDTHTVKGPGLARGPAMIVGVLLSAFGLILFLKVGNTPTDTFPDGTQNGQKFLGFETNGWTAWFTTAAGALLLFGAAEHLLAKATSLLVGAALGACAVIAFIDGDDVLGLAAANFPTKLGWAIAGGVLLFNTFAPRLRRRRDVAAAHDARTVGPAPAGRHDHPAEAPAPRAADGAADRPARR